MIFIAGATGFVGSFLLEWLKSTNIPIRVLVRDEKKGIELKKQGIEYRTGDITNRESLKNALEDVSLVIHLVGIMEGSPEDFKNVHVRGTENLINESIRAGVKTFFYQSALGASLSGNTPYEKTKAMSEELVRSSGIPYVIFRPSLIIGKFDGFTKRLTELIKTLPVVPIPGNGKARFQPIYIKDWVRAFGQAVFEKKEINRTYELGGPEWLTYNDMVQAMMEAMKIKKPVVHIPIWSIKAGIPVGRLLTNLTGVNIPVPTSDQLNLLKKDNITDLECIKKNFGFEPVRYREALSLIFGS